MMEWDHSRTRDVGQVIGAFMLVRRSVYEALGGFDDRFFLYYEDVDLCARNLAAGYRVTYLHTARAEHIGNVSSSQVPAKTSRLNRLRNRTGTLTSISAEPSRRSSQS